MLSLPSQTSKIRSLFEVSDLAVLASIEGRAKLRGFRDVMYSSREFFKAESAAKSLTSICLRANGELWLVEFRRSGSWKKIWNFGAL